MSLLERRGDEFVVDHMHHDFLSFPQDETLGGAATKIRGSVEDGRVMYYYVVDAQDVLVGVLPVRLLVTHPPEETVGAVCLRDIVTVDDLSTVHQAAKIFERYRYLALPVVDAGGKILGVLDLRALSHRELDISDRALLDEVFQAIGIRLNELLNAGPVRSARLRLPWLGSTIAGGALCAIVSGLFEATLLKSVTLALFLSMVLALGESTAVQSMTIVLQLLGLKAMGVRAAAGRIAREAVAGLLLGLACGVTVMLLSIFWEGLGVYGLIFLISITLSVTAACSIGAFVPWALHRAGANVKISSGPIVLALADACTIVLY
ncbi:MAG: CBS domain-containing protein, partial [Spirochaetaceae bacterium]|nr:CBS domain-containing protein [Spirochaetaceae bacterium]